MYHVYFRFMAGRLVWGMWRGELRTLAVSIESDTPKHYARVRSHLEMSPASPPFPYRLFFVSGSKRKKRETQSNVSLHRLREERN